MTRPRVAFAGDALRFAAWVTQGSTFVDTRGDDAAASLHAARPDVVVALGVADHEADTLRAASARVLGVVVPAEAPPVWAHQLAKPGEPPGRDVLEAAAAEVRGRLFAPGSPGRACDRLVALDPRAALGGRLWRTMAPPVDDALFAPVTDSHRPPRIVFHGASTAHREAWLQEAKHAHDVRHVAHGVTPERLKPLLDNTDVALVAHPFDRALHLAAGHLVVAEPLRPRHGLEPNIDYLETADRDALARILHPIRTAPDSYHRIRIRGRLKAERFRASHVWARVLHDFLLDVAA